MADYKEWEILKIQSTSLPRFHAVVYIFFLPLAQLGAGELQTWSIHPFCTWFWAPHGWYLPECSLSFSRTFALDHLSLTHDWGTFRKGREETRNGEKGTTVFQMGLIDAQHVSKQTFIILVKQLAQDNSLIRARNKPRSTTEKLSEPGPTSFNNILVQITRTQEERITLKKCPWRRILEEQSIIPL